MRTWNQQRLNRSSTGSGPSAKTLKFFLAVLFFFCFPFITVAQERYTVNRPISPIETEFVPAAVQQTTGVRWETNFESARQTADTSAKKLLIYLTEDREQSEIPGNIDNPDQNNAVRNNTVSPADACREFESNVLNDLFIRSSLEQYVLLKLPLDAQIPDVDGMRKPILSFSGFVHLAKYPGLAVMDFENRDADYFGQVTGILPFWRCICPTAEQSAIFLELPPGTLTQRTITYAVRIHPDKPLSSEGMPISPVVQIATEHSAYQAERGVLGHQNYSERSSRVIKFLGSGMPSEICAQSWSEESMFEGALNCMRSWRNSSAHWSIARKNHRYYGYDMAKGKNGAWYAVGFFID